MALGLAGRCWRWTKPWGLDLWDFERPRSVIHQVVPETWKLEAGRGRKWKISFPWPTFTNLFEHLWNQAEEAGRADLSGLRSHMLCGARCWDAAVWSRKDKPTLMSLPRVWVVILYKLLKLLMPWNMTTYVLHIVYDEYHCIYSYV